MRLIINPLDRCTFRTHVLLAGHAAAGGDFGTCNCKARHTQMDRLLHGGGDGRRPSQYTPALTATITVLASALAPLTTGLSVHHHIQ